MIIRTAKSAASFFLFFFIYSLAVASAWADRIQVTNTDNDEVRKLEVPPGQHADIKVYLKSFGDVVDNYQVLLFSEEGGRQVAALSSDQNGNVEFLNLPPGNYHVDVNKKLKTEGKLSTVSIGDVMLRVSGTERYNLGSE